jgi:hypothetical protein
MDYYNLLLTNCLNSLFVLVCILYRINFHNFICLLFSLNYIISILGLLLVYKFLKSIKNIFKLYISFGNRNFMAYYKKYLI